MHTRPTSVTLVAWYAILAAAFNLFWLHLARDAPMLDETLAHTRLPIAGQYLLHYIGAAVGMAAGWAMLHGVDPARLVFIGWQALAWLIALIAAPDAGPVLRDACMLGAMCYGLFAPPANAYFMRAEAVAGADL
ncbi:MAG: hypothetical protein ABW069_08315 [Duganella sp.]